jgi:class 3 adenylate cyclase
VIDVDLQRLAEAGLHDPTSPSASQREDLLRYLLEQFSVDEIVFWSDHTNVWGIGARAIDQPPPFLSAEEIGARAGVETDTVVELRAALGFPVLDPTVDSIPETAVDDVEAFLLGAELYGHDEALAFARVVGWAATRVTEAARAMFGANLARQGPGSSTELDMAKANEVGAVAWKRAQELMVHLLAEHPLRNLAFAKALVEGELQVAVGFVDLVRSTEWAHSIEANVHSDALRRFEMQTSRIAADHGARLVKLIGDEAMVVADSPAAVCATALAVCELARADSVLPDARGAVGFGAVTARDGDYVGPLVNTVARATKAAEPGEILVTSDVALALDPRDWATVSIGPLELRGVTRPVHLSRVAPAR